MENNQLDKKIIERVRNKIVISNLEMEEIVKINKRKHILSLIAVIIVMFTGGLISVNAATNGELVDKVKNNIKVVFTKDDGKQEELKGNTYTDSNNHIIEKYEINNNGEEFMLEVDRTNLDKDNMYIDETMTNGEINITIKE